MQADAKDAKGERVWIVTQNAAKGVAEAPNRPKKVFTHANLC